MLEFDIKNQTISRVDRFNPATDSVDYLTAKFNFLTDDWDGKTKKALFRSGTVSYEVAINSSGVCVVPWEVLVSPENKFSALSNGKVKMFVSAVGTSGTVQIPTNECQVEISMSGLTETLNGVEPILTIQQQFVKYFDIDDTGVIALKPKYRGCPTANTYPLSVSDNGVGKDGSEIYNLPIRIVIPEVINGVAVTGLANGMFYYNGVVEEIVIPNTITTVPEAFCLYTYNLRVVENTEHITQIGTKAFMNSRVEQALFPNLEEMGAQAFTQSTFLHTADIGKIQTIPLGAFVACTSLQAVKGGENVTTIETSGFERTHNLKDVSFLSLLNVTNIGNSAFSCSRIQFDWSKLTNCTFGTNATPVADNTTDYWSRTIGNHFYTPCENRLVTLFNQRHPLWANEKIGNTGFNWSVGCGNLCVLHIHSALTGKKYATPFDFEVELDGKSASDGTLLLNIMADNPTNAEKFYKGLGYTTTSYTGILNEAAFQDMLDALANGGYLHISKSTSGNVNSGHAIIAYGINELGEVMFADSDTKTHLVDVYNDKFTYQTPFQNVTGPDSDVIIVRKL